MPKKIPFRVVYCTGWEDDYPPKDLEVHSPFIKGWRSPRYCLYPQELVLRLDPPARVRKLQLLSHQYMIASKIDLYVGELPSDTHSSLEAAHFKRLGYVSLSDNEQTGYRSRELKSVNLDCAGHLIKLVLQPNHINRLNLFNQVSLVALNVIGDQYSLPRVGVSSSLPKHPSHYIEKSKGDPLSEVIHSYLPSVHQSQDNTVDPILMGTINKPTHISLMDDLCFAVAQDPQTADLIRALDTKKRTAVRDEEFQYAKQLKLVIEELQKIGEVLCRYEVEKKLAIEREDYDTAKQKKAQLDAIRKQMYEQLDIQGLLNNGSARSGTSALHQESSSHPRVKRNTPFDLEQQQQQEYAGVGRTPLSLPPISPRGPAEQVSPLSRTHHAEDRPLPALVSKAENLETAEEVNANVSGENGGAREGGDPGDGSDPRNGDCGDPRNGDGGDPRNFDGGGAREGGDPGEGGDSGGDVPDKPEPLSEMQLNKVSVALAFFGMELLELVFSKQYSFREKGLTELLSVLEGKEEEESRKEINSLVRATCEILSKALKDKVMSTFVLGLELLNHLVGPFSHKHKLGKPEISFIVDKVMPLLLSRTGDTAPRIIAAAINQISTLAEHHQIKTYAMIGPLLVHPFKQKKPPWKLVQSRVELLDRFYHNVGFESSGIDFRVVMKFLNPLLSHPNGAVREPAIKLVHDLYKQYGNEVRLLLPVSDDAASRRKTLWKTIYEGFDRIDGVPTQAEKEAARVAAEKSKNKEIQKLQGEVEALRQLAAQGNVVKEEEVESVSEQASVSAGGPPTVDTRMEDNSTTSRASNNLDTTCVFCGEQRREFAESGMEPHYLQRCPMLQSCPYCSQVIEISALTKHWLNECEAKSKFKECPHCREAVLEKQYEGHVTSCRGKMPGGGHTLCPLCHLRVQDGEESWRAHLMGSGPRACQKNPYRKGAPPKRPIGLKKTVTTGRGTNIPKPGGRGPKIRTK